MTRVHHYQVIKVGPSRALFIETRIHGQGTNLLEQRDNSFTINTFSQPKEIMLFTSRHCFITAT